MKTLTPILTIITSFRAVSPGRVGLALLAMLALFCGQACAQISLVDPINYFQNSYTRVTTGETNDYGQIPTISSGANCLVIVMGDGNVTADPPSLILSNDATTATYYMPGFITGPDGKNRNSGVYYLYNPPTGGPFDIIGTNTASSGTYYVGYAYYTLAGVDTTFTAVGNTNNSAAAGGNTATLNVSVPGCPLNGWAALSADWSPSAASLPINWTGASIGTPFTTNVYYSTPAWQVALGYSSNVLAGTDIFTATYTGSANKCSAAVAVFKRAAPAIDATNLTFSSVANNQMTVNWTSGNGTSRIVVASTAPITDVPVNGTTYTANAAYGSGTQLPNGSYAVYNGSGNSFTMTGLTPGTVYYFEIFEYNSPGGAPAYYTTGTPGSGSQTTLANQPTAQASGVNITGIGVTGMTINWTRGNGSSDIVVVKANSGLTSDPQSGVTYTANTTLGNGSAVGGGSVVFAGTGSTVTISGLSGGVTYDVAVYDFNGSGGAQNYLTPSATGSGTTTLAPPTVNSTGVNFTAVQTSQMTVNWTSGNGANRIVVAKAGSAPTGTPVNGSAYTANAAFGTAGTALGDGYVVYNGSGGSSTVTGLSPNTVYYYKIFEFNGSGAATVYLTSGTPGNGSQTTLQTAPTTQASGISFSGISATGMTINWTRGNGASDIVVVEAGSPVSANPANGVTYTANTTLGNGSAIGGGYTVFDGTGSSVAISGLSPSTTYYVSVYDFNGSGGAQNYLTPAATGSQTSTLAKYRSNGTGGGIWNVTSTWQESLNNGSTWGAAAGTPTSADGGVEILNNDAVTLTANVSIGKVLVDNGGLLAVSNGTITVSGATGLDIHGTLLVMTNDTTPNTLTLAPSTAITVETNGVIDTQYGLTSDPFSYGTGSAITNYGLFQMQTANGTVSTSISMTGSTMEIFPLTDCGNAVACAGLGQTFYNLEFNFANQGNNNVHASPTATPTVLGDLTILSTGPRAYSLFAVDGGTMNISGNVYINGGELAFFENKTTPATINIGKSLIVNSFTEPIVDLMGASATFRENINFTGSGTFNPGPNQTIDSTGGGSTACAANYGFNGNYTLAETWYLSGTAAGGADTVTNNGTLDCSVNDIVSTPLSGAGTNAFTLNVGATLGAGDPNGLDATGGSGNIQVVNGEVTFSSTANYIYDGASAQITGLGLPATVKTLIITNASGVTISQPTAVSGTLSILSGMLTPSGTSDIANTLTFNGSSYQSAGTWGSTSSTATHQDNTQFAGTGYVTISSSSIGPSGPGTITNHLSGSTLTLTWPAGQSWRLISQTNSLSVGLNTNGWSTVPGGIDGSNSITINPANPAVFYRLTYP